VPASSILLVEADPAAGDVITRTLSGVGYTIVSVPDADDAFRAAPDHHLIIIDVITGEPGAVGLCREIRSTPSLASIPVLLISQTDDVEERIRFLEAGADDVITRPFDGRELEARVEALLLRFQRTRERPAAIARVGPTAGPNRVVVFFSPKGGVGTTTVAVNVAVASALRTPDRTLLVDLDLQWGQVATSLNLRPRQTIADLTHDEQAQREPELLRTYASRHESGLHVLAAPGTPGSSELVKPDHVERLLHTALEAFDTVVVDAGSVLDECTLAAFDQADSLVLTVYPEVSALKAVVVLLDYLNETGSMSMKAAFVLNQIFAKELLKLAQVEGSLGVKISAELPYDPFLYLKAANEGIPVVQGAPRSLPAERLNRLARMLLGEAVVTAPAPPREERRGLLGFRRR
jgi:pilus assembly protein CpaE